MTSTSRSEDNKPIIRRFYDIVWKGNDIAAIDTPFADDFVNHDPGPHSPDREGFKQYVSYARNRADYQPTIEDLIAEGDKVVVRIAGRRQNENEASRHQPREQGNSRQGNSDLAYC